VDKPVDARATVCAFAPNRRLAWLTLAGATAFAVVAVLGTDQAGRLMAVAAALLLALVAGNDLLLVPRLVVSGLGLRIGTATTRAVLTWSQVDAVRVDERHRFGLASRTLEIDAGSLLVVLSRHALGADPRDVLAVVTGFRP
jgi:PH (Pleckstrin Homology) domain-containing protein